MDGYVASQTFSAQTNRALHLGLCPVPFVGSPSKATVFILMLNPGLSPGDYFAEEQSAFRSALRTNLKGESEFLFLDPRFAWHPGFTYWHGKLASVVRKLATERQLSYQVALGRAAANICVLQLVPYHSSSFGLSDRIIRQMRSPGLARCFVHDHVMPRARRGEATIIVTRKVQQWGLEPDSGAVLYEGNETRAAHLTANSRGGSRIVEFLVKGTAVAS
jgi:hypothetical protein